MNEFIVSETTSIDFGATGVDEILQNVGHILTSSIDSCPMDRDFAWSQDIIDAPIEIAKALISSRIIDAIRKYEPRVEVVDVSFEEDQMNGVLKPKVRVRIRDDSEI